MGMYCIMTSEMRNAEEMLACWQSGQEDYATASAAKSTGGDGGAGPALAGGT
jgi:hypothetical protein